MLGDSLLHGLAELLCDLPRGGTSAIDVNNLWVSQPAETLYIGGAHDGHAL
jgi:hypothetical protein